jgi:hypothetical protein
MYALAVSFIVFVTVAAQSQVQSAAYSAQAKQGAAVVVYPQGTASRAALSATVTSPGALARLEAVARSWTLPSGGGSGAAAGAFVTGTAWTTVPLLATVKYLTGRCCCAQRRQCGSLVMLATLPSSRELYLMHADLTWSALGSPLTPSPPSAAALNNASSPAAAASSSPQAAYQRVFMSNVDVTNIGKHSSWTVDVQVCGARRRPV